MLIFRWFLQVVYPVGIPKNWTLKQNNHLNIPLMFSKFKENCLKHAQVYEKKNKNIKKNTRNIWRTLKVPISMMAGPIWLKFCMECVLPRGAFQSKNGAVPFWHYWVTDMWKWCFLGSYIYNTHLLICHATAHAVLGSTTLYSVSWPQVIMVIMQHWD